MISVTYSSLCGILDAYLTSRTSLPRFACSFNPGFRVVPLEVTTLELEYFSYNLTLQEHFNLTMAAMNSPREEDLLCPQCCEIYRLPVLLKCGHNVCRVCLQKFWELKGCRECPVCRTVAEPGRPPINLPLKIAADEYQLRRSSRNRDLCFLHGEKLTLFCQNDEEPVCVVCHTSKQHKVHECCPVEEAAQQKKVDQEGFVYPTTQETQDSIRSVDCLLFAARH